MKRTHIAAKDMTEVRFKDRMNILHVIVRVGPTSLELNELCLPLLERYQLSICSYLRPQTVLPPEVTVFEGDGTLRGFWRAMRTALKEGPYDVIHVHTAQTAVILMLINLLSGRWTSNAICTVHNCYENFKPRNKLLLHAVFAVFPKIVLCGQSVWTSLPWVLKALGRKRISIVQNGVDTERIGRIVAGTDRSNAEKFTIAYVARLIERKNPKSLLRAFAQCRNLNGTLVFVGGGELESDVVAEAERLGLNGHVDITGLIDRDRVYQRVAESDVGISTSWGEGLPVAVLETMACGCPVILSDIPSHREIAEGVDFIPLIKPDDVDGFAREVERYRRMTSSQRAEIGRLCQEVIEERFSLKGMHRLYEEIYTGVAKASNGMGKRNVKIEGVVR